MDNTKFEKAIGLPAGHLSMVRKAIAESPAKLRAGLKAAGYPRFKAKIKGSQLADHGSAGAK